MLQNRFGSGFEEKFMLEINFWSSSPWSLAGIIRLQRAVGLDGAAKLKFQTEDFSF
jgi:hypothetical protein